MSEKAKIEIDYELFDSKDSLPDADKTLLAKAEEVAENAYAPYSNYLVGAAVLTESGKVVTGNNQENIAYPSGLCAERTAIFYLGAQYPKEKIVAIAVAARKNTGDFGACSPCGGCRQVMVESEDKQQSKIRFIMEWNDSKIAVLPSVSSFMPLKFDALNK